MRSPGSWRFKALALTASAAIALQVGGFARAQSAPASPDQNPHQWRKADEQPPAAPQTAAPVESQGSSAQNGPAPAQVPNDSNQVNGWPDQASAAQPEPPEAAVAQQNAPYPAQQPPYPAQQGPYPAQQAPYPAQQAPYPAQQPYPAPQPNPATQGYPAAQQPYPAAPGYGNESIPATLTIPAGTYITVRVNGWLSSDHNQPGDGFTGTVAEPVIVNGIVVARRGQTVGGVVTEANKAGRVEGTSRLGLKLTDLTLVDGQKVNLQTSVTGRRGNTSQGRDAAAIGSTTALGAAVGAAADWGRGAAIGAGAGAAAGIIGVLLTRGQPTVIYPETALTFRVDAAAVVNTTHAPQAFRYADDADYGTPAPQGPPPARMAGSCYGCAAPAPYYGPGYSPYSYPYYFAPGFSLYVGPRYFGPRFYYGPRFYARGVVIRRR